MGSEMCIRDSLTLTLTLTLTREQREQEAQQLLAHKVDTALAGGLKVSSKEAATA